MGRRKKNDEDGCAGCLLALLILGALGGLMEYPVWGSVALGGIVVLAIVVLIARSGRASRVRSRDLGYRFDLNAKDDDHEQTDEEAVLCGGARSHRCVAIRYQKPDSPTATDRLIEPYHFMQTGKRGKRYVLSRQVSPKPDGHPWRTFRIDRILQAESVGPAFTPVEEITIGSGRTFKYNAP